MECYNYFPSLQLQALAPFCIPIAGLKDLYRIWVLIWSQIDFISCVCIMQFPHSKHLLKLVVCLFCEWCLSFKAPLARSWPPAMSACLSPRMQETHGDRWGDPFFFFFFYNVVLWNFRLKLKLNLTLFGKYGNCNTTAAASFVIFHKIINSQLQVLGGYIPWKPLRDFKGGRWC